MPYPCCCHPCTGCIDNLLADEVTITLGYEGTQDFFCVDGYRPCSDLAGEYVLTRVGTSCFWRYSNIDAAGCAVIIINLYAPSVVGNFWLCDVFVVNNGFQFYKVVSPPVDCTSHNGLMDRYDGALTCRTALTCTLHIGA
jgi:hypothetical protein